MEGSCQLRLMLFMCWPQLVVVFARLELGLYYVPPVSHIALSPSQQRKICPYSMLDNVRVDHFRLNVIPVLFYLRQAVQVAILNWPTSQSKPSVIP